MDILDKALLYFKEIHHGEISHSVDIFDKLDCNVTSEPISASVDLSVSIQSYPFNNLQKGYNKNVIRI